ncbi:sulfurtransferase [Actinotalea ferrariae CF5-4]|uniref:Sulfurtransferase n=1 Tax=Actinotalea ferrariae CF5-4 TaxID=948458 RepID=A0A021VP64_9CELL|nr:rhodanese-like domain-containing protein [Actinotalea ferrariae]EYR62984.1 sulfurtransferase [Actinotalea ferrariae CF5-4]
MSEVTIEQLAAAPTEGAYVVDVREPQEYVAGHVPGAVLLPMSQLGARVGELPTDRPLYLVCRTGNRSLQVTTALRPHGYDAHSVRGGTEAWVASGRAVITGTESGTETGTVTDAHA